MPLTTAGANRALQGLVGETVSSAITHMALFNGDPSGAGVEISGGSYARQSITWNTVASGNADSSNTPTFDVPAGATVNFVAYYDALTGGNLLAYRSVTQQVFSVAGTYVNSDTDISIS